MDGRRVLVFGVAALSALTLAVAAASVSGPGSASANGGVVVDFESGLVGDLLGTLQFGGGGYVTDGLDVVMYVPGLIAIGIALYGVATALDSVTIAGFVFAMVAGFAAFLAFPLQEVPDAIQGGDGGTPLSEQIELVASSGKAVTIHLTPIVGTVALLVVLSGAAIVLTRSDEREDPSVEPIETSGPTKAESLGSAAGRAAEQLDGAASFENAIYEAWHGMVTSLSVDNPESTTPGEFADRAIEAGLSAEDVEELTALFETVRYGNAPVTEHRRQRAHETLRRIEAEYAGETDE